VEGERWKVKNSESYSLPTRWESAAEVVYEEFSSSRHSTNQLEAEIFSFEL